MTPRARTDWLPLDTTAGQLLRGLRWSAIAGYLGGFGYYCYGYGVPLDREGLLLWIASGLAAGCIGRHPSWLLWVALDFVPFAAVLVAYDYLRGLSDKVGLPTWWHPQIDIDKFLFFGHVPTVWLQEHLKHPSSDIQWYDVVVCLAYISFFFLPYLTAGLMWLRSRADFYRWTLRFVGLSFFSFALFLLIPAAPPWAAARCTPAEVAGHPNNPDCMYFKGNAASGGLLGKFTTHQPGAHPWVEQIATRGFFELHLGVADNLISKGRGIADAVAAVPSLHVGGTVLFVIFVWSRLNRWWRPLLVAYPLVMMFSLAYGGEHYVADGIAGALAAVLIHWAANRIERRWARRATRREAEGNPDTLESLESQPAQSEPTQETPCPPTRPQPATTPSST